MVDTPINFDLGAIFRGISPDPTTGLLIILSIIILIFGGIFYFIWRKGWFAKYPIAITVMENRGDHLAVKNRTAGRLVETNGKTFYRIKKGKAPWNYIDWVAPPDFNFIDDNDHAFLWSPNRDEYHAMIANIRDCARVMLASQEDAPTAEYDIIPRSGNVTPVFMPLLIKEPVAGWKPDMSTSSKTIYKQGVEAIERRRRAGSWLKEYQGLIAIIAVSIFILALFYISWAPLVQTSQTNAEAFKSQTEMWQQMNRVLDRLNVTRTPPQASAPPAG